MIYLGGIVGLHNERRSLDVQVRHLDLDLVISNLAGNVVDAIVAFSNESSKEKSFIKTNCCCMMLRL